MNIAIRIKDGVVQQVTSDEPALQGVRVAVVERDIAERIVEVTYEEQLSALLRAGTDRTICHAVGMACDVAAERMAHLATTQYDDPVRMVDDLNDLIQQLSSAVARAVDALGE